MMKDATIVKNLPPDPRLSEGGDAPARNGNGSLEREGMAAIPPPVGLPAIPAPLVETRWRLLELAPSGLVATPLSPSDHALAPSGPIVLRDEQTPATFVHLFANVERLTAGLTVIGITSAVRAEGRTTVALHLARSAAKSSYRRVCLVDLSLGEDELCRRVGAAPAPGGVVNFLESDGVLSVLEWPGPENMALFAAGKAPVNASRTARSPRIAELIAALRDEYDLVIVDLPAVSSDNVLPIARHLDGCVMVARAGATPRGVINAAIDTIGRENFVGVVLNQVAPSRKRQRGGDGTKP